MLKARLFIATVSMVSMVFQPVAYGQTQENWAAQALKDYVRQGQKLGKRITVKEFWEKNKRKLHPDWQKRFFPAIEMQKDEQLPQMEVITVKGVGGQDTARLMITLANKKTVSIEIMGTAEKFARINGQIISYQDLYSGDGIVEKLTKDPVIAAEAVKLRKNALKASIMPSYALFTKMTKQEKAEFLLNLRHVVQAAAEVQNRALASERDSTESASFIHLLLEKAYAGNIPEKWIGKRCIVAGYVGRYTKNTADGKSETYCDHVTAVSEFANLTSARELTQNNVSKAVYDGSCGQGNIRCNPYIYGFERGSGSLCVKIDRSSDSFQRATRTCDKASPLRKENLASDTEEMLKTLLKKENKDTSAYFGVDGKVISEEKYKELMGTVVKDFHTFIDEALATCDQFGNKGGKTSFGEKNQGDACSVLEARRLAFIEGIKLLEGKYQKPTPTPAPPESENPQTPAPVCKKPGDPCESKDGKGICNEELKCVAPGVVPKPDDIVRKEKDCGPMMVVAHDKNGDPKCVGRSALAVYNEGTKKIKKKNDGFDCDIICPLGIMALFAYAGYRATKSNQRNNPGNNIPPAPPQVLPTPTPQPAPTPVPPISPTLPIPNPAGSEYGNPGVVPTPGGPGGVGTR